MKDKDRPVLPALNSDDGLPERLWAYDDFLAADDPPVSDFSAGLVSLGYLKAGLRRSARLWCATAALGLVCGLGLAVAAPPAYQATTTVLLTHNSSQDPTDAVSTDISLAGSHTVADRAMAKLGLTGNAGAFVAAESVSALTNRVLQITVSAPSSAQAVARAQALATEFLAFRAEQLQDQQQLVGNGLDQQVNQAKAQLAAINQQISQLSGQSGSAAKLTQLNSEKTDAANNLDALQQTVASNQASGEAQVLSQIKGSQVLDAAAPVHHSALKTDLLYALIGLVAGLVAGPGLRHRPVPDHRPAAAAGRHRRRARRPDHGQRGPGPPAPLVVTGPAAAPDQGPAGGRPAAPGRLAAERDACAVLRPRRPGSGGGGQPGRGRSGAGDAGYLGRSRRPERADRRPEPRYAGRAPAGHGRSGRAPGRQRTAFS